MTAALEERKRIAGPDVLWTAEEACAALGVSRSTLDRLPIPRIRLGNVIRYCPQQTMAFARSRLSHRITTEPTTDATNQP